MELNTIQAGDRSRLKIESGSAGAQGLAMARPQPRVTKDRKPEAAEVSRPDSRAARCRCIGDSRNVASTPLNRKEYAVVNLGQLEIFEAGSAVDMEALVKSGLVSKVLDGIKILATGELTKSLVRKSP